jgi:hypothetical protein
MAREEMARKTAAAPSHGKSGGMPEITRFGG